MKATPNIMQIITPDNEILPSTSEYTMVGLTELRGKSRKQKPSEQDMTSEPTMVGLLTRQETQKRLPPKPKQDEVSWYR